MSTVLQFEPEEYLEIRDMNREQLLTLQTELKEELAELDAKEPKNMKLLNATVTAMKWILRWNPDLQTQGL